MNDFKFGLALLIVLFCFARCTSNETTSNNADSASRATEKAETKPVNRSPEKLRDSVLYRSLKYHAFSNPDQQDLFTITVIGDKNNYQKAQVVFKIFSWDKKEIYSDTFEGSYLIDYGILEKTDARERITDKMRETYVQERLQKFFDDSNFKEPAIAPNAKLEEYYQSKELFNELKKNKRSIAFYYLLGKEDGKHIAYSAKLGKAVIFYNCC